jgi:ZIP family zinc transporter
VPGFFALPGTRGASVSLVFQAFLIGLAAQSSLLLTALVVYRVTFRERLVGQMAGLGAGALIGAAAFQLVPEAQADLASFELSLWLLVGAAVFVVADKVIERRYGESGAMGIVVGNINDALPESLIFGIQLATASVFNPTLAASVWVSNVPQVLPPAADLRATGWPARKQVVLWGSLVLLCGVFSAAGFAVASAVGDVGGARIAAFTIGGLIAMLTTSMIPFAYSKGGTAAGMWAVVGFGITLAAS